MESGFSSDGGVIYLLWFIECCTDVSLWSGTRVRVKCFVCDMFCSGHMVARFSGTCGDERQRPSLVSFFLRWSDC